MLRSNFGVCLGRSTLGNMDRWLSQAAIPRLAYLQFTEELKTKKPVVIDVREPDELTSEGKISGAKNVPLGDVDHAFKTMSDASFASKYGFKKPELDEPIVIHCKKGIRAMKAATTLTEAGFEKVKVYSGIDDWVENGGKLER